MDSGPDTLLKFLEALPPWVGGVVMAVTIAILRVIYDKEETSTSRVLLEGLICGALTLTAGSAIEALGISHDWHLFLGGVIGFIGSHSIRQIAIKYINRKIK